MNKTKQILNLLNLSEIKDGYIVSESIFKTDCVDVSHYALSYNQMINHELSCHDKLYIALNGKVNIELLKNTEQNYKLTPFDAIYIQQNTSREVKSSIDYSFLMITLKRTEDMIKNLDKEKVLQLAMEIPYQANKIVSKTLVNNEKLSMTLLAFDGKQELSTHKAPGDALVIALDGKARINIDGNDYIVNKGESIIMPANIPHGVYVAENSTFQMLLIVSK